MTLVEQIISIYPQLTFADFISSIVVQDDGTGPYIKEWGVSMDQPTQDQLDKAQPALALIEKTAIDLVQKRLDDFAQTRNYIGIVSACTYVNSTVPRFQTEGTYCLKMRDATWATCYQILADVQTGLRAQPTVDEVLKELPELIWPN